MTRRRLVLSLALAAALGVTACSASNDDNSPPTSTSATHSLTSASPAEQTWLDPQTHVAPILAAANRHDPVDVGRAVAEIACTWSPIIDLTETAALLRAKPLLTEDYGASLDEPQRGASQSIFVQAAAAKAVSVPTAKQRTDIADAPPSTDVTQYLAYTVTWVWTTAEHDPAAVEDSRIRTVYVVVQKQVDGTWLASHVDSQDQQAATSSPAGTS